MNRALALCAIAVFAPSFAVADVQLSFYGSAQTVRPSEISIRDPQTGTDAFSQTWANRPFSELGSYGVRATRWQSPSFGYGLDFASNQVSPANNSLPQGYDALEFNDGLNTLTINAYRRWNDVAGGVTPYIGGGVGVAIPHVNIGTPTTQADGYQFTGPAATVVAGASVPIGRQWSVFGEYKGTVSSNSASLDNGGALDAEVMTNAVNFGVSFDF